MRLVKMLLPLLAVLLAGSALAGHLSPGLEAYLAEKHDGGPVTALLVLQDQVDVAAMDLDLHYQRADLARRHYQVVTALQERARDTQDAILADLTARKGAGVDGFKSYWLINAVLVTGTEDAIRDLAARKDVEIAELDLMPELIEPVDVASVEKGAKAIGITPGVVNIGARRVWDELGIRGDGALIASLDTGVDGNHVSLSGRWRGTHAPWQECWLDVLGTNTTFPEDGHGHGTHTTGTMTGLAAGDTIGVAPGAEWIAANAINQESNSGFDNDILDCFEFFTDPDGDPGTIDDVPDVVQNSWGVNENFTGYVDCDSRWWDAIDACEAAGVIVCWSAGNEGPSSQTLRSPGDRATTLYNCFSVGSTEHSAPYTISSFSSRGPAGPDCGPVENRVKPEVSAPGGDIYSAQPGGGYQYMSGTSMAGPHVAGVIVLMRAANPNVDAITAKQILMETAVDLGDAGEDNTYGHGFIDAFEAVQAVLGGLGWVEGAVTDAGTGLPIEGAAVTVVGGFQNTTSAADGTYRLTLPVGDATVHVEAFGYAPLEVAVTIADDATTTQDLDLDALPNAVVSGIVYGPGQAPPSTNPAVGAIVAVRDTPLEAVTTGADGRFAVTLPTGADYVFAATLAGSGAISQTVPVIADMDLELYLGALTQDGFETGDLSGLPWSTSGNADWSVQTTTVHAGANAAVSGDIGDNQNSDLTVTVDCGVGGEMSFWYKVSSESGWDFFEFHVDGSEVGKWSGEVDWTEMTTTVTAGTHTFRWNFDKDYSVSSGSDCAWIDDVTFPGGGAPTPLIVLNPAVPHAELETGETVTMPWIVMNQGQQELTFSTSYSGPVVAITNDAGSVEPFGYHAMELTIDAAGLAMGIHQIPVTVTSNDPLNATRNILVNIEVAGDTTPVEGAPKAFALVGAVPNPFNPQTTIHYDLPRDSRVSLRLYDVQGRLVRSLVDDLRPAGRNEALWNGRDASGRAVASGTYFARLQADGRSTVKAMVLVR